MQSLINFLDNYVAFDFENKPGQKIKIVGTYDDPYFCGIDVCAILEYKNVKDALQKNVKAKHKKDLQKIIKELKNKNPDSLIGIPSLKPTYHEGKAVYISKDGLVALLTKSKTLASYRASQIISEKLGLNIQVVYAVSKQQQTLNSIKAAFKNLLCISEYKVESYRIDLYFPELKLAVECDEHGHVDRDKHYEKEREECIKNKLKCVFVRYNPDSSSFDIGDVIHKIMNIYIKHITFLLAQPQNRNS